MRILIAKDDFMLRVLPVSTGCSRRWTGRRPCALPATAPKPNSVTASTEVHEETVIRIL